MKLTKDERATLREKFGGRCAYCGEALGKVWHGDHLIAVERKLRYESGKGFVATGELRAPEHDTIENMMPACPPCNIDKHMLSLEAWRTKLSNGHAVLMRNNPTYRHTMRFGLIAETRKPVVFYFETLQALSADRPNRDKQ